MQTEQIPGSQYDTRYGSICKYHLPFYSARPRVAMACAEGRSFKTSCKEVDDLIAQEASARQLIFEHERKTNETHELPSLQLPFCQQGDPSLGTPHSREARWVAISRYAWPVHLEIVRRFTFHTYSLSLLCVLSFLPRCKAKCRSK